MKYLKFLFFGMILLILIQNVNSAHYIVGYVNNARDGTIANGHTVMLWNSANGISDNLTDIIGPNGNSEQNNIYMIDCELLNTPCNIGNTLKITVVNNGDNYISVNISVVVSGAGYDIAPNITLNSPPDVLSVSVDDILTEPANEIDLVAAGNRTVNCIGIVNDLDNDTLQNLTARFFDDAISSYGAANDNNTHYTNDSCYLNTSYSGSPGDKEIICSFYIEYYANPGSWRCVLRIEDNLSIAANSSDLTNVNSLLAIGVDSPINYSSVGPSMVSNEIKVNVTNYGNVKMNLSLKGYAANENDGFAMNCTIKNISIQHEKYNLTTTNSGSLSLSQFEANYTNLTSNAAIKKFNLNYRQEDSYNDAINTTYWRIYAPIDVNGNCSGYIQFGAVVSGEN